MKLSVERGPFAQILEMIRPARPGRDLVWLLADRDRLCVQSAGATAEVEAVVWEGGRCAVSSARLLAALKACRPEPMVTVESHGMRLRVGDSLLLLLSYRSSVIVPNRFQIFLAASCGSPLAVSTPNCLTPGTEAFSES